MIFSYAFENNIKLVLPELFLFSSFIGLFFFSHFVYKIQLDSHKRAHGAAPLVYSMSVRLDTSNRTGNSADSNHGHRNF